MKRFKLRELIVKLPSERAASIEGAEALRCEQVTLLECANGVTAIGCQQTLDPGCRQVTLLNCGEEITRIGCGITSACAGTTRCEQVTLLNCADGATRIGCDGSTIQPQCRQVTILECGGTYYGAPMGGTHHGPRCCQGCTDEKPCTGTEPPPPPDPCGGDTRVQTQDCTNKCPGGQNCGLCTNDTPRCTSATDDCGTCTHGTDDAALFVRTFEVDRMSLESLSLLKQQLHEVMARAEEAETRFEPTTAEDLDALEAQLKAGLDEIKARRGKLGPDKDK